MSFLSQPHIALLALLAAVAGSWDVVAIAFSRDPASAIDSSHSCGELSMVIAAPKQGPSRPDVHC